MAKLFVVDIDRRKQKKNSAGAGGEKRFSPDKVTRRYALITDNTDVARIIEKEFTSSPHAVFPNRSGNKFIFFSVISPSAKTGKAFTNDLLARLEKNRLPEYVLRTLKIISS